MRIPALFAATRPSMCFIIHRLHITRQFADYIVAEAMPPIPTYYRGSTLEITCSRYLFFVNCYHLSLIIMTGARFYTRKSDRESHKLRYLVVTRRFRRTSTIIVRIIQFQLSNNLLQPMYHYIKYSITL